MLKHNETTLARAAAAYGPMRTENAYIRAAGHCAAAIGALTDELLRLQEGLPVYETDAKAALDRLFVSLPALWVAAERVGALLGQTPNMEATTFYALRTAELDQLESKLKRIEDKHRLAREYPPGTMLYDKHEILDLAFEMAAREAAKKEGETK